MDRLPAELLCNIATLLDKGDAATLRIVCKAVSQAATSALFSNVKLFPADKSIAKFLNVISTPNLASCVRVVCIETSEQDQYVSSPNSKSSSAWSKELRCYTRTGLL